MLRLPIILSLLLIVASCGFFRSPDKERCRSILPREKMTDMLTDIYLLEAYLSDKQTYYHETRDSVDYYFAAIYQKHGVHYNEFKQALDCYLLHRSEMELIHEEILNRLSIKQSEADAELERYMQRQHDLMQMGDTLITDTLDRDFMRR